MSRNGAQNIKIESNESPNLAMAAKIFALCATCLTAGEIRIAVFKRVISLSAR
jgi:hypothetical protein